MTGLDRKPYVTEYTKVTRQPQNTTMAVVAKDAGKITHTKVIYNPLNTAMAVLAKCWQMCEEE